MTANKALCEIMELIHDHDLVRNTDNDQNTMAYMRQGIKIIQALKDAEDAIKEAK